MHNSTNQSGNRNCCLMTFLFIFGIMVILGFAIMGTLFTIEIKKTLKKSPLQTISTETQVISKESTPDFEEEQEIIGEDRIIHHSITDNFTINILRSTKIPINDPIEIARKLGNLEESPVLQKKPTVERKKGIQNKFWVLNGDINEFRQVTATLQYITPHLFFWVEDNVFFEMSDLKIMADIFENEIYTTTRKFFGSEPMPGIDGDVHLSILYAKGLGSAAGYFYSNDSLPKEVEPFSNESEMFYLSADYVNLNSPYAYGVLAHEFQHMIHWNIDRDESLWINEGLSELSTEINGYENGGFPHLFAYNPDIQLNFWPGNDQGDSSPHYGASYLFMKYLMDRFGSASIQELVSSQENGLESIDDVYSEKYYDMPAGFTAEKIFQDWAIANYSDDLLIKGTISGYSEKSDFPKFTPTETLSCDSIWNSRTVNQFGTDYISVNCQSDFTVEIKGNTEVGLLPTNAHSGEKYFWSNYGNSSHMKLIHSFDFSQIESPITLNYWTWFDIEKDYDYVYLTASIKGEKWEILEPTSCVRSNPTGGNLGCGYNGISNGWVYESADLSKFAGKQVTLQFEYITDLAVNGDGFAIDDISIKAVNYSTDSEMDYGGWESEGFIRVNNILPQNYGVSIFDESKNEEIVKRIYLGGLDVNESITPGKDQQVPIIIINGLTRFTRIPADYQIRISSKTTG